MISEGLGLLGPSIMVFHSANLCTMTPGNPIQFGNTLMIYQKIPLWFPLLSNSTYFPEWDSSQSTFCIFLHNFLQNLHFSIRLTCQSLLIDHVHLHFKDLGQFCFSKQFLLPLCFAKYVG